MLNLNNQSAYLISPDNEMSAENMEKLAKCPYVSFQGTSTTGFVMMIVNMIYKADFEKLYHELLQD